MNSRIFPDTATITSINDFVIAKVYRSRCIVMVNTVITEDDASHTAWRGGANPWPRWCCEQGRGAAGSVVLAARQDAGASVSCGGGSNTSLNGLEASCCRRCLAARRKKSFRNIKFNFAASHRRVFSRNSKSRIVLGVRPEIAQSEVLCGPRQAGRALLHGCLPPGHAPDSKMLDVSPSEHEATLPRAVTSHKA